MASDPERQARAGERWRRATLHRARLQKLENDPAPLRGAEAVSLVHRLTLESWSLAGLEQPDYSREQIPCRFVPGARG